MTTRPDPILDGLSAIHAALLHGDFAALAALAQDLEQGLTQPAPIRDAAALSLMRRKATENAALLLAAQRGLRAAQRRIAEIRGVATGLTTYTAAGSRLHSVQRTGSDHRA
jgi:hypothetical protein